MPVFVAALLGGLVQLAASMAGRVLIALGVGFVSYIGLSALQSQIGSTVMSSLSSAGAGLSGIFGLLRLGACVNVVLSAYAIRMTLDGLGGDVVKRWVLK